MANTYKALSTVTVGAGGAATIAFTNIPQTYTDLVIRMSGRSTTTDVDMFFTFNSNTLNYTRRVLRGTGSNASSTTNNDNYATTIDGSGETSNTFANLEMYIPNYASSNFKAYSIDDVFENNSTTAYQYLLGGLWSNTSPATSLTFYFLSGGTFAQYTTATLYGVFNADVSSAPATPTIGTATAATATSANITFTPVSNAASYTATSTPGSLTGTSATSPVTVSGLTTGTSYTFKVKSNNPFGSSAESAASNSITPNGSYESIATISVGAGGASSVVFSSIPGTYTHLQLRGIVKTNATTYANDNLALRFNNDTGANYTTNHFYGFGGEIKGAQSIAQATQLYLGYVLGNMSGMSNMFSAIVVDILDYAVTTKLKTVRTIEGGDINQVQLNGTSNLLGGLYFGSTSAITNINMYPLEGTLFLQNTTFALYGIKSS